MATLTLSLSPSAAPLAGAMSSRRVPLTSNPHAANSPMRAVGGLKDLAKHKRSYANTQREDAYGQPPPDKKQVLDNRTGRPVRSPSKLPRAQSNLVQRMAASHTSTTSRPPIRERTTSKLATTKAAQDEEHKEMWKKHYRAKFPKMVFYFENIPDDVRAKLTKRIGVLGAVSYILPGVPCRSSVLIKLCYSAKSHSSPTT